MAEFQEVMRQINRMCNTNATCLTCPLYNVGCSITAMSKNLSKIEQIVMSWAAEHLEPVYPRWLDWLMEQGIIPDAHMVENSTEPGVRAGRFFVTIKAFEPIPADIAEKLGIEPKGEP